MQLFILSYVVIFSIITILYLRRDKEERNLYIKLIGYYLLGSFTLNLGSISLPLGFVIYLFLRPKLNVKAKRVIAIVGLLLGYVVNLIF